MRITMLHVLVAGVILLVNGCSSFMKDTDRKNSPHQATPVVHAGDVVSGEVIRVIDGDTIRLTTVSNLEFRVRLAGIDAPERYQAYGDKARQALSDKIMGKAVALRIVSQNQQGEVSAFLFLGDRWIDQEMVAEGWAWRDRGSRIVELSRAEQQARARRVGLWGDDNPMAPWEYRDHSTAPAEEHDGMNTPQPFFKIQW